MMPWLIIISVANLPIARLQINHTKIVRAVCGELCFIIIMSMTLIKSTCLPLIVSVHTSIIFTMNVKAQHGTRWKRNYWNKILSSVATKLGHNWSCRDTTHRAHDAITTSLLRQNDIAMEFWRSNNVIIASRVRWKASNGSRPLPRTLLTTIHRMLSARFR